MMQSRGKVLLIDDQTGRGHAICDLFVRTDPDTVVYYGPAHPAIVHPRVVHAPSVSLGDVETVAAFCKSNDVDFTFVSWINSLSLGYVDALQRKGLRVVGPTQRGAELETSKRRGKRFCIDHGIPTPEYMTFDDPAAAKSYVRSLGHAAVVKEDGLRTLGDGAHMCSSAGEAEAVIDEIAVRQGRAFFVLIERRHFGTEISIFAFTDGKSYVLFPAALDYKRALDGDRGKNCAGMGSIAPHPAADSALYRVLRHTIMDKVLRGLVREKIEYTGFIYVGALLTDEGPVTLEINARFGDSEAQAVLPSVRTNFTALCRQALNRQLDNVKLDTDLLHRCCIVATQGSIRPGDERAKPGWPFGDYDAGHRIEGVDRVDPSCATVFFAGTGVDREGSLVTARGRVLNVVGLGVSREQAIENAYRQLRQISFPGMRYRSDIGRFPVVRDGLRYPDARHRPAGESARRLST
jgi:phosphoribosylamine--glycine ligase